MRRAWVRLFGLWAGVMLVAAACGGSAPSSSPAATTPATSTATTAAASAPATASAASGSSQASNQTLVIAIPSDMQNLDPTLSSGDLTTQEVLTNIYSWLINYKLSTNAQGQTVGDPNQFVGNVAQSYDVSADGKTVTFHLRPGIKFANGDPIDANAVKFTYDRIFGQNGVTAALSKMAALNGPTYVTVTDPETVVFHLAKANTLLFGNMAQFGHSILDPKVVKAHETSSDPYAHQWLASHATGTESGPYVISQWQPGNEIVLTKNPNYWGTVKNQEIILKIIPDPATREADLKAGAVDIAYDLPLADLAALKQDAGITLHVNPTRAVAYIGMNNTVKPFDNVQVRQAIDYAFPYQTIIDQVLHGYGIPLTSPIPQGTPYHTGKYDVYKTDPAKAKALLTQAGYPNGFTTTFQIPNDDAEAKETAVWLQSALQKVGITVNISQEPGAAFTSAMQHRTLTFFYANQWISINNDPFYHLFWLFHNPCCDYTKFSNPTVNNDINTYTLSTNASARQAAAVRDQQVIMQQAPWVFMFQPDLVVATRSNVKGYVFFSADRYMRYQYLYKQ